ncbi:hypothetical protein GH5_06314 [Leishmania sp. Ghana 2012 LV757]|uniref:hypothetical protein n=1 Tax=Leishmania sp. Ghana 2012 LV757 TaxID=2803181 RepID=UPI001B4D1CA8|nr:hypothetical protein GH5_06314 [Leishmania sp. Ghana 2012 LV757]
MWHRGTSTSSSRSASAQGLGGSGGSGRSNNPLGSAPVARLANSNSNAAPAASSNNRHWPLRALFSSARSGSRGLSDADSARQYQLHKKSDTTDNDSDGAASPALQLSSTSLTVDKVLGAHKNAQQQHAHVSVMGESDRLANLHVMTHIRQRLGALAGLGRPHRSNVSPLDRSVRMDVEDRDDDNASGSLATMLEQQTLPELPRAKGAPFAVETQHTAGSDDVFVSDVALAHHRHCLPPQRAVLKLTCTPPCVLPSARTRQQQASASASATTPFGAATENSSAAKGGPLGVTEHSETYQKAPLPDHTPAPAAFHSGIEGLCGEREASIIGGGIQRTNPHLSKRRTKRLGAVAVLSSNIPPSASSPAVATAFAAEEVERRRLEAEEAERRRLEAEEAERRRLEAEEAERRRPEAEEAERRRLEAEEAERRRLEAEEAERRRLEAEEAERRRLEAEEAERRRLEAEEAERRRLEAEEAERRRPEAEEAERRRLEAEEAERRRLEAEEAERRRLEAEEAERRRLEAEEAERRRLEAEEAERRRLEAEEAERRRLEAEEAERRRLEAEEAERRRLEAEEAERRRLEAEEAERRRLEAEEAERRRLEAEEAERRRLEAEEAERRRLEAEEAERRRLEAEEAERRRLEAEEAERRRLEAEEAERRRLEAEEAERRRLEAEEAERRRLEAEEAERRRLEAEEAERRRPEAEEAERRRLEAEEAERRRLEAEEAERRRLEAEEAERRRLEAEEAERRRLEAEEAERRRLEAEEAERRRLEAEEAERRRLEAEEAERRRLEAEEAERRRLEAEEAERRRLEAEEAERRRLEAEEAERRRLEAEEAERRRLEAEEAERRRLEAEEAERRRLEAEEAERRRLEAEEAERRRLEAEEAERRRLEAEEAERRRLEAEEAERRRLEAEEAERRRLEAEEAECGAERRSYLHAVQEVLELMARACESDGRVVAEWANGNAAPLLATVTKSLHVARQRAAKSREDEAISTADLLDRGWDAVGNYKAVVHMLAAYTQSVREREGGGLEVECQQSQRISQRLLETWQSISAALPGMWRQAWASAAAKLAGDKQLRGATSVTTVMQREPITIARQTSVELIKFLAQSRSPNDPPFRVREVHANVVASLEAALRSSTVLVAAPDAMSVSTVSTVSPWIVEVVTATAETMRRRDEIIKQQVADAASAAAAADGFGNPNKTVHEARVELREGSWALWYVLRVVGLLAWWEALLPYLLCCHPASATPHVEACATDTTSYVRHSHAATQAGIKGERGRHARQEERQK